MKNFRVTDGDLDINQAKRVDAVQGRDKLVQDLTLWLLEPLGIGFTTPGFGSLLNSIVERDAQGRQEGAFVGKPLDDRIQADVEAEVDRILNLYQQDQVQKIRSAQVEGRLYLYSRKEILDSIDSVQSSRIDDRAIVKATLTTGANQAVTLMADVDGEESNVAPS